MTIDSDTLSIVPSLKAVEMLIEEYDRTIPFGIAGVPEAGKTIFSLQESAWIAKQIGGNVLILDTEGGGHKVASKWYPVFSKKFDWDGMYIVRDVRMTKRLLNYLYYEDIDWRVSGKGKIDIRLLPPKKKKKKKKNGEDEDSELSDFERDIINENISVVVIDSLSKPLKEDFVGGQLNFPGRSNAINLILGKIQTVAIDYNLFVMYIHHLSKPPEQVWDAGDIVGGVNVKHSFKVWLLLSKSPSTAAPSLRYFSIGRYYDKPPRAKKYKSVLTSDGFVDHAETIEEYTKTQR